MYPASMTKVMTLLVACEHLTAEQLNEIVIVPKDIVDLMKQEAASGVPLSAGEEMKVIDLLYAIALESDGAAAMTVGRYVAGNDQAFVEMMNQKADDLSLMHTNFCNATGLHHAEHVSTCREMASIMLAAMDNELVKTLLSTKSYTTAPTNVAPDGRVLRSTYDENVQKAREKYGIQAQPVSGTIISVKTGYTPEAGYCLVSYYEEVSTHKPYIIVTAKAAAYRWYILDHVMLYEDYAHD